MQNGTYQYKICSVWCKMSSYFRTLIKALSVSVKFPTNLAVTFAIWVSIKATFASLSFNDCNVKFCTFKTSSKPIPSPHFPQILMASEAQKLEMDTKMPSNAATEIKISQIFSLKHEIHVLRMSKDFGKLAKINSPKELVQYRSSCVVYHSP